MIFNSVTYLLFLAVCTALYWLMPRRPRLLMLFIASIVFYGFWSFLFVPLMLASVLIDYSASRFIARSSSEPLRRAALAASLIANLGLLGFFKYYFFFTENIAGLAGFLGVQLSLPNLSILLPVGISFYTFQSMSYTIDVYRRFTPAIKDFTLFGVYVMFFPQLIAGPILRAGEVVPQLDRRPVFRACDFAEGLRRILGGLFLKVVLADNLAGFVDDAFSQDPKALGAVDTLTMAFLFGFQIYFDFAAYSHIALGSALLMGVRFPENFCFPYLAASPREFWKRWHISLSSWIRDYLYLPLTGAKVQDRSTGGIGESLRQTEKGRLAVALFLTWAIMGLWHGAAWAYVIWGLWHAALIQVYRISGPARRSLPAALRSTLGWVLTVNMVMLAWIPFRTQSVKVSVELWGHLINPERWLLLGLRENAYLVAFVVMAAVLAAPAIAGLHGRLRGRYPLLAQLGEACGLSAATALVLVYLRPVEQFIYFQF